MQFGAYMKDTIIIANENLDKFKEACRRNKISFEIVGEGIDGDDYELTFDRPSQLYYLGREIQLAITTEIFINQQIPKT